MSDELKPCPFCGATHYQHEGTAAGELWFSCQGCGATGPVSTNAEGDDYSKAQEQWNTRPIEDALFSKLETVSATLHREIETNQEWERQYNHRIKLDQAEEDALRAELAAVKAERDAANKIIEDGNPTYVKQINDLTDELSRVTAERDALLASRWIPVEDSLPVVSEIVDVLEVCGDWSRTLNLCQYVREDRGYWWSNNLYCRIKDVTHWKHIP